jgi:hypothetical protein
MHACGHRLWEQCRHITTVKCPDRAWASFGPVKIERELCLAAGNTGASAQRQSARCGPTNLQCDLHAVRVLRVSSVCALQYPAGLRQAMPATLGVRCGV